ncbi:MAG: glycoside hydrolase family 125 protein [Solirubrobacterales bacterium]
MSQLGVRTALGIAMVVTIAGFLQPSGANARVRLAAVSQAAESYESAANPPLAEMFHDALLDSLQDATDASDGTVYIRTGDIRAEWLRDSSAQVRPYLYFAAEPAVREFLKAVIGRQATYITADPYANAFTSRYRVWESKFELDSLCYPVLLVWTYWKVTGDSSVFTPGMQAAFKTILKTMRTEQHHDARSRYRNRDLPDGGRGGPVDHTGMIWSGFLPSDDAPTYHYPIASEMMAVQALSAIAEVEQNVYGNPGETARAYGIRQRVNAGIQSYGIVHTRHFGAVYAYEVDGRGHYKLMDDANVPSLISAPYLGYGSRSNRIYENTRRFALSGADPYYYRGRIGAGIGSSHTPRGYIWPMALVMQALTSTSQPERESLVEEILASAPGEYLLHESFNPNHPRTYTRRQFGWPNALFSELVLRDYEGYPPLPTPSTSGLHLAGQ